MINLPLHAAQRQRGLRPVLLVALVLVLHAWLLGGMPLGGARRPVDTPSLQLRHIVLPAQAPRAAVAPAPEAATPAPASPRAAPVVPAPPLQHPRDLAEESAPTSPAAMAQLQAAAASAAAAAAVQRRPSAATVATAAAIDADGQPLPVYATRMPGSATLNFVLHFGALSGDAQLHWRVEGNSYELMLEGLVFGRPLIQQVSTGMLDDSGVAPVRFTDRRRGRAAVAANFQREGRRITFSGPRVDYLLPPGAQDRLSVLVQLGAVVAALQMPPATGSQLIVFVADARGNAGPWRFTVEGEEALTLPAGPTTALKLRREPRHEDDASVEVWLDASREWWPVRIRQGRPRGGDLYDLQLISIAPGS